jgi:hypothetical protein
MKNKLRTLTISALAVFSLPAGGLAGSVTLEDFDFGLASPSGAPITSTISAMWGTYSAGVFTPLLSNTQQNNNTGYADGSAPELSVVFTQPNNNNITAGASLFVSIFNVPGGAGDSTWSSTTPQIVLGDPTWTAPTFQLTTPNLTFELTANTQAQALAAFGGSTGTYNFNGGDQQIQLVPEPSTYALLSLAGLALGGYAARRRRRA